jgi:hypothetical protein
VDVRSDSKLGRENDAAMNIRKGPFESFLK